MFVLLCITIYLLSSNLSNVESFTSNCPSKFLLVGIKYGRLNNHLISISKSVAYAQLLNRTLIVGCKHHHLDKYFEFNFSCVFYWNVKRKNILKPELFSRKSVKVFFRGTEGKLNNCCFGMKSKQLTNVKKTIIELPFSTSHQSIIEFIDKKSHGDKLIVIPWPFKIPTSGELLQRTMTESFPFKSEFEKQAKAFMKASFPSLFRDDKMAEGDEFCFVGIHSRNFEGNCSESIGCAQLTPQLIRQSLIEILRNGFNSKMHQQCQNIIKLNINRRIPMFLASDGQNLALDQVLETELGAKRYILKEGKDKTQLNVVMDMMVLVNSAIFIGNGLSTLSTNIVKYRNLKNKTSLLL